MTNRTRTLRLAGLLAASALAVTACGGGDTKDADATPTPTPTPTSSDGGSGVEITPPGTQLAFGETASVDYQAKKQGTVLDLTVDSATQGSLKDFSGFNMDDPYRKNANYYYVRVEVSNAGEDVIGGVDVPLWGISGRNTLLPIVKFTSPFKKCPTQQLPKKFKPGDDFKTCLVFLSPDKGTLAGVSYRPSEDYVPIEWHGEVKTLPKKKKNG